VRAYEARKIDVGGRDQRQQKRRVGEKKDDREPQPASPWRAGVAGWFAPGGLLEWIASLRELRLRSARE
jgi:hypothetical protein